MKNKTNANEDTAARNSGVSRRTFLKGVSAAGAMAALGGATVGLAACSPQESAAPSSSDASKAAGDPANAGTPAPGSGYFNAPSWATPPAPIADSDISETIETEVLVLGAGNAGVASACSAAENGAKVVVCEKTATVNGRGGGVGAVNSRLNYEVGATTDVIRAQYFWNRTCGNRNNERLVTLFMNESGNAMNWLLDKADKYNVTYQVFAGYSTSGYFPEEPSNHTFNAPEDWESVVPEEAFSCRYIPAQITYMDCLELGVEFLFEHVGLQLVKDDSGKVSGAIVEDATGAKKRINASKAVILATGDIHGDQEMMDYYCEDIMKNVIRSDYTPVGINTGDGHKMGMWAGGVMQESPFPVALHPQAGAWFHGPFMFVNFEGRRFFNEATWVQAKSIKCMEQTNHYAFSIFDSNFGEDTKDSLSNGGGMFWDSMSRSTEQEFEPEMVTGLVESQAADEKVAWKADTLEELADKIGVDKEAFLDEVKRYNEFCEKGLDEDYHKEPGFLYPIKEPPFYATMCAPAILVVTGGLKINTELQVLDENGEGIPGLYAVGNTSGDLHAVDYPITVSSNSNGRCFTWGWLVGQQVANL
ncbi:FAD-dependent oxidoreductase [Raoultibacter phocaeensis]|uniref:FAD-dependent oxidoreductase n=1 Tax=Raoultibacter phocaeensis TaxID=2479841 RepID=UPI00111A704A|nr:FAD-binding protein [Raoultibacter phocaeensis]